MKLLYLLTLSLICLNLQPNTLLALKLIETKASTVNALKKPKILFFAGSARKDSFNKKLAYNAFMIAKNAGIDATFIDLKDFILPIYDGDLEKKDGLPAKVIALKKIIANHDGIFIASPEYNGSISPLLKNTLDWVSRYTPDDEALNNVYENKVIAFGAASPAPGGGQNGLIVTRMLIRNLGAIALPQQVTIKKAREQFDEKGNLINQENLQTLKEIIEKLIHLTTTIKNG